MKIPFLNRRQEYQWYFGPDNNRGSILYTEGGEELYSLSLKNKYDEVIARAVVHESALTNGLPYVETQSTRIFVANLSHLSHISKSNQNLLGLSQMVAYFTKEKEMADKRKAA